MSNIIYNMRLMTFNFLSGKMAWIFAQLTTFLVVKEYYLKTNAYSSNGYSDALTIISCFVLLCCPGRFFGETT